MKKDYLLSLNLILLTVLALGFSELKAQERTVQGKVTAEADNSIVPGVSVSVKGTTTGTITDANGTYKLTVPSPNSILVFSFVGFTNQEVAVGSKTVVDIQLAADVKALSEVVVTGYTTQDRREVTGAVSTIRPNELVSIPQSNVEQQMQGRVSGVTVVTSGQPGSSSLVRVRGFGSFVNNQPLYIVDGVPTTDVSYLNSNDIETTTILKDAGAASIWGSRAAGGVIVYTTKHGKPGTMNFTYDGSYGVQSVGKGFDMLNPQETANATWQAYQNAGQALSNVQYGTGATPVLPDYLLIGKRQGVIGQPTAAELAQYNVDYTKGAISQIVQANKTGTDWYKAITHSAPIQNHNLGISGGTEGAKYYVGLGYFNQQGVVIDTYYKRYTARINTEFNYKKRVRIGENLSLAYRLDPNGFLGGGNLNEGNPISLAYRMNTIIPVYDINGGYAGTAVGGFNNPSNPVANLQRSADNVQRQGNIYGNVYAEADVIKDLTIRTSFGGNYYNRYYNTYSAHTYENSENNSSSQLAEGSAFAYSWTWTNTAHYSKKFGIHSLNALAGIESNVIGAGRNVDGTGLNPFTTAVNYRTLSTTQSSGRQLTSGASQGTGLFSYFGQVNYGLMDKYLLSAVVRRDGSSVFGSQNQYGVFPAFTAAWRISEESFMKNSVAWVNDLKIRGGWGEMGNQSIPGTNIYNLYAASPGYAAYDITGANTGTVEGLRQTSAANVATKWETNISSNIGLDATLFNNSLEVVLDLYQRTTKNMLYNPQVPATAGDLTGNYPYINVGSMQNKGIDLQLIKRGGFASDWHYEANLTFSLYRNKITKIADGLDYFDGNSFGSSRIGTFTRNAVGHPISAFFGYQVTGLFQSSEDVKNSPTQTDAAPGRFKYKDVNGDGQITPDDRTYFGNPNPSFTSGLNLKVGYKGFDLEMFLYWVQGNKIINYTRWFTDFYSSFAGAGLSKKALYDSWSPSNPGGTTPILENISTFSTNQVPNSYYMENGSYLRARNVQLSYTVPNTLLSRVGVQKLRIYLQTTNLFTITKYTGLDPGVSGVDTNFGVDYGNYPLTRQYILGVNVGF